MSTSVTLRPNATVSTNNVTITGGGGTASGATNDNSDASHVDHLNSSGFSSWEVAFDSVTLPANSQVRSVTARLRHNNAYSGSGIFPYGNRGIRLKSYPSYSFPNETLAIHSGYQTQTFSARTTDDNGNAWNQASIDDLRIYVEYLAQYGGFTFNVAEAYIDVVYNESPVASSITPSTTQGTTRPTIGWTYSDPEGDPQERYRVKVFSSAQYTAGGFDPETSTPTYDSGEVYSAATSHAIPIDLANGLTYRAYVAVADAGSSGRYSRMTTSGPYGQFTVSVATLAVPDLYVDTYDADMRHEVSVFDRQNRLSTDDASFESSIGTWTSTATIARLASANAVEGGYVLDVTSGAAVNGSYNDTGSPGAPVLPGRTYSAVASVRAVTATRTVEITIMWYNASNVYLSATTAVGVTDSTSTNTLVFTTGVAPATAAYARVRVWIGTSSAGEHHYVDVVTLVPYALNMLSNPLFEIDTNSDGVADDWSAYTSGAGSATRSIDTNLVWGGVASQRINISGQTAGSDYKGLSQATPPVKNGTAYTMSAWVYSDKSINVNLWHSRDPLGAGTVIPANTWTRVTRTFTANSDGTGNFIVRSNYIGTASLWVGHAQMELGSAASTAVSNRFPWLRGGVLQAFPNNSIQLQRSADGGATWSDIERVFYGSTDNSADSPSDVAFDISDTIGAITFSEYESPRGIAPLYRVRTLATVGGNSIVSMWSQWVEADALSIDAAWIKDPLDQTRNMAVIMDQHVITKTRTESQGIHYALGRSDPIVVHGTVRKGTFPVVLFFTNDADYAAWLSMQDSQRTLLLQTCYGDETPEQYYFTIDPDVQTEVITAYGQSRAQPRRVTFTARETVSP